MKLLILVILYLYALKLHCQTKIEKLIVLSKVYGYARNFYPSAEADNFNWDQFLVYAIKEIETTPKRNLNAKLVTLFKPITPAIQFSNTAFPENHFPISLFPDDTAIFKSKYLRNKQKKKYSKNTTKNNLVEKKIKITESVNEKIGNNLFLYMPLVLLSNDSGTFPKPNKKEYASLLKKIKTVDLSDSTLYNQFAGVIITWNTIQHYYPYRDFMPLDWDEVLKLSLVKCNSSKQIGDYIVLLKKMLVAIKDGHANAYSDKYLPSYFPPLDWRYINDTLIVTNVIDSLKSILSIGDIVLAINHQDSKKLIEKKISEKSSASNAYSRYISAYSILPNQKDSNLVLRILKKNGEVNNISISRSLAFKDYWQRFINPNPKYKLIGKDIVYLNFHIASKIFLDSLLPYLKDKKIICDLRGYPSNNHDFLSHILRINDTSSTHFKIPIILYPNYNNVKFTSGGWRLQMHEPKITNECAFLIDNSIISYGESFMSTVEHYKLGTIIGDTTAGTNGDISTINLPVANISISYTGLFVTKLDGRPFHGIGVIPDILVKPTIRGIKEGKDEILEKAIAYLSK